MRYVVVACGLGVLGLMGCAPSAPPPAACAPSVDPGTVKLLNQYAHTVENLRGLAEAHARRDDAVMVRRLELDTAVRGRLHEVRAVERRLDDLAAETLATAKSDAERGKVAIVLSDLQRGRGDRTGPSLPAAVRASTSFRSLVEVIDKRDALVRDLALLEAQIGALDTILGSPTAPRSVPVSMPARPVDPSEVL